MFLGTFGGLLANSEKCVRGPVFVRLIYCNEEHIYSKVCNYSMLSGFVMSVEVRQLLSLDPGTAAVSRRRRR